MKELTTTEELNKALKEPVAILFKHSTQCPISAGAYQEMQKFTEVHPQAPVYLVKVIESRPISNEIAEFTDVKHESPQVIILEKGKPVWHKSHHDITAADLENATVDFR
jgi:bacillithiol system protein YtxJ